MATQGEIIRGVLSYQHPAGSVCQNVFTWELQDEDSSDAECLTAIDDWVDVEWADNWDAVANDAVQLYLLEVDVLTNLGLVDRNIGESILSVYGDAVGEVTPAAVSGFVQASTERAKSFGRKYIPGIDENAIVDGIIDAPNLAHLALLFIDLTTDIDVGIAGLLVPGVLSRVTDTFQEFTGSGYVTDVPAYQRRRKPNVGS